MCGIAGIVERSGASADLGLLRAMTTVLAHRGPDGEDLIGRGSVGLGHRRLAIIDLATGDQPMSNEDGSVWIVFNGEIYNFRELRQRLEATGARFRTTSDTEVILRAWEIHGAECLSLLRGMFAFAILDERAGRIFLARDRVGIKPLVYAWDGRRLLFASEIKALLQDPSLHRDLDWEALGHYLTLDYIPGPATIFRHVRKLPPGSSLMLDLRGGEPEVHRYWDLRFAPDPTRTEAEWLEGLRWHLGDAVRSHMVSDVPIGAFLSGGMDSSSVVALMAQARPGPVRTFSIGFSEADFDELAWARQVAQRYGTDHYEFVVKPDALQALSLLAWQFDEPFADSSAIPTYYVAKMTAEHVKVALSGDGGDEDFAGYRRYARAATLHARLDGWPGRMAKPLLGLAATLIPPGVRGRGTLELLAADPIGRYARMMASPMPISLLSPEARAQVAGTGPLGLFQRLGQGADLDDYVSTLQYLDVRSYLPEDILTKVDRATMLTSLEARVPLLDHVLMEYLATMPAAFKLRNGEGKAIFKQVMAADLPEGIRRRPKMGFGVPLGRWFRAELADHVRDVLLDRRTRARGWLDATAVEHLLDEHQRGRRDWSRQIWSLLFLEEWARRWLDR